MADGSFPNWKRDKGHPRLPETFWTSPWLLGPWCCKYELRGAPPSLFFRGLLGTTQTFSEKTYTNMKSYTISEILRGAGRILLPWKADPEPARLSRVSVLFRAGVSHEINSEEKQPPCPAEASKKRRSHHHVGNRGGWGGKEVLMCSSVYNSLPKKTKQNRTFSVW